MFYLNYTWCDDLADTEREIELESEEELHAFAIVALRRGIRRLEIFEADGITATHAHLWV
jgi:hypothetical protein